MVQMVRDYETDILDKIMLYDQQESKSFIAHKVKGHYNTILDVMKKMIERNILEIKKGKLKIKPNDVLQQHEDFQGVLKEFKEGIETIHAKIKKNLKGNKKTVILDNN